MKEMQFCEIESKFRKFNMEHTLDPNHDKL